MKISKLSGIKFLSVMLCAAITMHLGLSLVNSKTNAADAYDDMAVIMLHLRLQNPAVDIMFIVLRTLLMKQMYIWIALLELQLAMMYM